MFTQIIGYVCCLTSVIFYGFCYVPVKKVETGDGIIYQWVFGNVVGISGILIQMALGSGKFYTISIIGGFIWASGNIFAVCIVRLIGLSLGLVIWSIIAMLEGWACSRFGLFYTKAYIPRNEIMSYFGIIILILGTIIYGTIEITIQVLNPNEEGKPKSAPAITFVEKFKSFDIYTTRGFVKKVLGIFIAIFTGLCYGFFFEPANFLMMNIADSPKQGYYYAMGAYLGVFLGANFYFILYCLLHRNLVELPSKKIFMPSCLSGILWSGGSICWFIANDILEQVIAFPMIAIGPSLVAGSIGIIFFKEIQGTKNFIKLAFAALFIISGIILNTLSR